MQLHLASAPDRLPPCDPPQRALKGQIIEQLAFTWRHKCKAKHTTISITRTKEREWNYREVRISKRRPISRVTGHSGGNDSLLAICLVAGHHRAAEGFAYERGSPQVWHAAVDMLQNKPTSGEDVPLRRGLAGGSTEYFFSRAGPATS